MTKRERYTTRRAGAMRSSLGFILQKPPSRSTAGRAEVIKWLRETEDDPWYKLNPVPLTSAAFNGILGRRANGNELQVCRLTTKSPNGRDHLSPVLVERTLAIMADMEAGRLVFWRAARGGRGLPPYVAHRLQPPDAVPFPQRRLVDRCDYDWWARCTACGQRRYAAIVMSGREEAACWNCVPPAVYGSIAAIPSTWPIIPEMIAKWATSSAASLA